MGATEFRSLQGAPCWQREGGSPLFQQEAPYEHPADGRSRRAFCHQPAYERCELRARHEGQASKVVASKEIKNTNLMGATKGLGREPKDGAGHQVLDREKPSTMHFCWS